MIPITKIRKEPHLGKSQWRTDVQALLLRRGFYHGRAVARLVDGYVDRNGLTVEIRGGHRVRLRGTGLDTTFVAPSVSRVEKLLEMHQQSDPDEEPDWK